MSALDLAEKIGKAIEDKTPGYKVYVRQIDTPNDSYIETALRPVGGTINNEIATAFSEAWFNDESMTSKDKAKQIYSDLKVHIGS